MSKNDVKVKKQAIKDEFKRIKSLKKEMKEKGLTSEQIKLATDPLIVFNLKMEEELKEYEKENK